MPLRCRGRRLAASQISACWMAAGIAPGLNQRGSRPTTLSRSTRRASATATASPTTGDPHARHSVKFYLVALLFIVFDVESVFIYPWGSLLRDFQAEGLGWFAYVEMLSFMGTLALGLVYVWRKGALEWS